MALLMSPESLTLLQGFALSLASLLSASLTPSAVVPSYPL